MTINTNQTSFLKRPVKFEKTFDEHRSSNEYRTQLVFIAFNKTFVLQSILTGELVCFRANIYLIIDLLTDFEYSAVKWTLKLAVIEKFSLGYKFKIFGSILNLNLIPNHSGLSNKAIDSKMALCDLRSNILMITPKVDTLNINIIKCWNPYKRTLNRPKFSETLTVSALARKLYSGRSVVLSAGLII
ncbi:hypothetical protein BpHYR1_028741 [Brachionus plicatilis]|uniref:Uncharacterized protein n=1 Tax=Brachionus plicatilis TaxID=10195 RepID=A0A3M7PWC6_BRAPC|nr:hypothetical protein BpHYR1_028741 [Brachionus plicatilis]